MVIEADTSQFQLYSGGVFTGACGDVVDHTALVVGYDTDPSAGPFFILQNTWGSGWGNGGYIWLPRGESYNDGAGQCGVYVAPTYPTMA